MGAAVADRVRDAGGRRGGWRSGSSATPPHEEQTLDFGLFTMPSHPPERDLREGHEWDLRTLRWADEYGFTEAWIGEHHTAPWEPHPSPDLLVAQSLMETKNIRLGPGGFLLPYHHPAELANRVAILDTWPREGSTSGLPRADCRATGRCSTWTGCRVRTGR